MFIFITFRYYLNPAPGSVLIFRIFKSVLFTVLTQHPLMVQGASSSKFNQSQAKSTHAFKVGPPGKKPFAVSLAKAKKTKQQTMKKHIQTGKCFSFER